MDNKSISHTKYKVIIKKANALLTYAKQNNQVLSSDYLSLLNRIKENNFTGVNPLEARNMERYTQDYGQHQEDIETKYSMILRKAHELIKYSIIVNFKLCDYFWDDLKDIKIYMSFSKLEQFSNDTKFSNDTIKSYIQRAWREEDLTKIQKNGFYLLRTKKNPKTQFSVIRKNISTLNIKLSGRTEQIFNKFLSTDEINITKITKTVLNDKQEYNKSTMYEIINRILYDNLKDDSIKSVLYNGRYKNIRNYIVQNVSSKIDDLTKHDTAINVSTLTHNEILQALNNSMTKFIELHYQQPQELKHILIEYRDTALNEYLEVTTNMIRIDEDMQLLTKVFKQYKQDTNGRVYNYDLFAFLYYAYSLTVSFEHLYSSELLKILGVYTFKADRNKPTLKQNATNILKQHKQAIKSSQYDNVNIYIENLLQFLQEVNTKHFNIYLLSFLVDMSHSLKNSKDLMESLTAKKNFNNITYEKLPQPINTLLLPHNLISK